MLTTSAQPRAANSVHVVFVHGFLSGPEVWQRFTELLERDPELEVVTHRFGYGSPVVSGRPDRQIPEPDDIADQLGTYLRVRFTDDDRVVLVGHSQGGLFVQRYLSRTLRAGRGRSLARVIGVVTYACPNGGSKFLALWRRLAVFWRNPQERQLRVFHRDVLETQRHVLEAVVNAREQREWEWHIPVFAYGGAADRVVPARVARGLFPEGGVLPGDHFGVVQPRTRDAESYRVLKEQLRTLAKAVQPPPAGPEPPPPAPQQAGAAVGPPGGHAKPRLQGREREKIIRAILSPPAHQPGIHVLTGLGGSGKTRVALEIAERARQTRRVWWIPASQISASMREVARQLQVPSGEAEAAFRGIGSSMDLVWRYLEDCPDPWTLVFDNVDTPKGLGSGSSANSRNSANSSNSSNDDVSAGNGWIREPTTGRGCVVVTSRDLTADTWLPRCVIHRVPPLQDNDGAAMLLECAPGGGTMEEARRLSAELGGLPLALKGAAAYVRSVRGTALTVWEPAFSDFASYREAVRARMESPPGTNASVIDEMFGESIMAEVCGIALELLAERGFPQAAPLLKVFACLNVAPIPYRLLMKSPLLPGSPLFPDFPAAQRDAVLRELARLGLVEEVELPGTQGFDLARGLSLHPVVHGLLRGDGDVQRRRADYYGLTVRMLLDIAAAAPADAPENWDVWGAVLPHAIEVARTSLTAGADVGDVGVLTDALELTRCTARYLIAGGPLAPADDLLRWLVGNCRSYGFEPDDREILGLRHEKGRIALEIGEYATAERELAAVVADRERVLGVEHTDTLASRHKHAKSVLEQGRWAEAAPLLRAIVAAEYQEHGAEHSDTITVRHSLARARIALGEPAGVEAELRDILEVSLRHQSPNMPETLRIRQTLARSLLETGRPADALAEVGRALHDTPQGRLDTALAMSLRGTRCLALLLSGHIPEALAEATGLVEDRERVLGPAHPETVRTLRLLAQIQGIPDASESERAPGPA